MAAERNAVDMCLAVPATLSWTGILRYHINDLPLQPRCRVEVQMRAMPPLRGVILDTRVEH